MEITVIGSHTWSHAPERGTVHLNVDIEGDERAATTRAAAALIDGLAAEVHALSRGEDATVTWSSIGPLVTRSWRPYQEGREAAPPRFGAGASITVTFNDVTALSDATIGWAEREGVQITDVSWTLTDALRTTLEAAALTRAVEQARSRALAIAQASGWNDVIVQAVADPGLLGGQPTPEAPAPRALFSARADMAGPTITPEDVRGDAVVHARFTATR